jgi:hypothetical protein
MALVVAAAASDGFAQADPGSEEARMQECMKYASQSVCERRIKGPAGQPAPLLSEQERMENCMQYASQSICERRIKGPSGQPKTGGNSEEEAMRKCMKFASESACRRKIMGE